MIHLLVLETSNQHDKGHYIPNLKHLIEISNLNMWKVTLILTPITYSNLELENVNNFNNIDYIFFEKDNYANIMEKINNLSDQKIVIIFPWWNSVDLNLIKAIHFKFKDHIYRYITIIYLSNYLRASTLTRKQKKFFKNFKFLCHKLILFYWDPIKSVNSIALKDFQMQSLPEVHENLSVVKRDINSNVNEFKVGFFGNLTSMRGIHHILILAILNKKTYFHVYGYNRKWYNQFIFGKENQLRKILLLPLSIVLSVLIYVFMNLKSNIVVKNTYFRNQLELNEFITKMDYIYIATNKLFSSSGIALQSLSCNVPVIYNKGKSAAFDNLIHFFKDGLLDSSCYFVPNKLFKKLNQLKSSKVETNDRYSLESMANTFKKSLKL